MCDRFVLHMICILVNILLVEVHETEIFATMIIADCDEPMVDGQSGVLLPSDVDSVSAPDDDGFTCIEVPNSDTVVLQSSSAIRITDFLIKVDEICSNDSPLSVTVKYFNNYGNDYTVSNC